jgi:hypothetical protein
MPPCTSTGVEPAGIAYLVKAFLRIVFYDGHLTRQDPTILADRTLLKLLKTLKKTEFAFT